MHQKTLAARKKCLILAVQKSPRGRPTNPHSSDRNRGDATARWFARAVSDQCRTLFGSPMYGLVAIIASVTLGRKIVFVHHPAVRAAKNDPL
jgi:hypothetical protein